MKKYLLLGTIIILLAAVTFFLFTLLLARLFSSSTTPPAIIQNPTPRPTFTATPTLTPAIIPTTPSETATPTPLPPTPTAAATATPPPTPTTPPSPTPAVPQVVAQGVVNIRSGPGTNYPVIGELSPETPLKITGRNEAGSWWQIEQANGTLGWVAGSVVEARNGEGVPVAQAPPPPIPTPTPVPPEPTPVPRPAYQYEPTGWYGSKNLGLTRFLGTITDANGNAVNGVYVEAQCGTYRVISDPSGKPGWPAGFYDITLDTRPIPCKWFLTVVETADGKTAGARLSESVEVETTVDQSIVTANWRKNW